MSRDAIIYTIEKGDFKESDVIDIDDLNYSDYLYKDIEEAPDYLKQTGTIVTIRFHLNDLDKACYDAFNSKFDSARCLEDGYIFSYKNKELGYLSDEKIREYDFDEERLCYVAKIEEICSIDNCYSLSFDDGIYTFDEILDECIRIGAEDGYGIDKDAICGLVKALKYSREGKKIYIFVD